MSQSLANLLVHIIFSTKDRLPLIRQKIEDQLHSYIAGIFKEYSSPAIIIGGTDNHIHILCSLSKKNSLSKVIENVKKSSSKWIKTVDSEYRKFYWQNGYGAFSIGASGKIATIKYIRNQKKHHRPKLSDFILYVTVAEGFSLRFLSSDGLMRFSRKLRNLKVAATIIAQLRIEINRFRKNF